MLTRHRPRARALRAARLRTRAALSLRPSLARSLQVRRRRARVHALVKFLLLNYIWSTLASDAPLRSGTRRSSATSHMTVRRRRGHAVAGAAAIAAQRKQRGPHAISPNTKALSARAHHTARNARRVKSMRVALQQQPPCWRCRSTHIEALAPFHSIHSCIPTASKWTGRARSQVTLRRELLCRGDAAEVHPRRVAARRVGAGAVRLRRRRPHVVRRLGRPSGFFCAIGGSALFRSDRRPVDQIVDQRPLFGEDSLFLREFAPRACHLFRVVVRVEPLERAQELAVLRQPLQVGELITLRRVLRSERRLTAGKGYERLLRDGTGCFVEHARRR